MFTALYFPAWLPPSIMMVTGSVSATPDQSKCPLTGYGAAVSLMVTFVLTQACDDSASNVKGSLI